MKRPGLAGFLLSYLVVLWMALCGILTEVVQETHRRIDADEPVQQVKRVGGAILAAMLVGLLAIPVRLLLGLIPEPSPSSAVRLVRRALFGALCGAVPMLLILALSGKQGDPGDILALGVIIGLAVGIVDSLVRDARTRVSGDADLE